eukprot:gene5477-5533_t
MFAYIIRRVLATIPVMAVVALFVFSLLYIAPGDPAAIIAGDQASPADVERIRASLGLDRPFLIRFGSWVWDIVHGDLGTSIFTNLPVTHMIAQRIQPTLSLMVITLVISLTFAIPLGVVAAWKQGSWIDRLSMILSTLGFSVPVFVVGYVLAYTFALSLDWVPVQGYTPIDQGLWKCTTFPHIVEAPALPNVLPPRRERGRTAMFIYRYPTIAIGGVLLALILLIAIFAPYLGTVDPTALAPSRRTRPPPDFIAWATYYLSLIPGVTALIGTAIAIFGNPQHPYTRGLLGAVPKLGSSLEHGGRTKLVEIGGQVPSLRKPIIGCAFAGRCPMVQDVCRSIAPAVEEKHPGHLADRRMTNAPLLEVNVLKKHFPLKSDFFGGKKGFVYALDGVTFSLAKGETLSVVGESGCGKSTLGKTILRLVEPTDGEVLLDGVRIDNLPQSKLRDMRRRVQVVFQDPFSSLNPRQRVRDIIGEPIVNFGLASGSELEDRVAALMDKVRLPLPVPDPTIKRQRVILKGDVPSPINPPSGCRFHTRCPYVFDRCKVEEPQLRPTTVPGQRCVIRRFGVETIVIIGASRGLGLGLAREYAGRGWRVIGTVRNITAPGPLQALAAEFPDRVTVETVDINIPVQVTELRTRLDGTTIDMLFVNAGIANGPGETLPATTTEGFTELLITNALSPLRVVEAFADLVPDNGVIAAMSSGLGSVANNTAGGWEIYRASKASLNTLLRSFAVRRGGNRTVLAIAPGWVRTDMGGPNAHLDIETSVRGMADTIAARMGSPGSAYVNYLNQDLPW